MGRPEFVIEQACTERGAALMGILNLTPDSFYDGGRYVEPGAARERIDSLIEQGADIVDLGGESTRPGSLPVAPDEQFARIEPALRYAVETRRVLVSVDTASPEVARRALELGADFINDVSCLKDSALARVVADFGRILIVMHSRGPMSAMPGFSKYPENGYADVVADVRREWRAARDRAIAAGLSAPLIWFDPGIGFNKSARHSFALLARLHEFRDEGVPIVVGPSRKSFISKADPSSETERLGGTIAACLAAVARGASVLRVHDVREVRQALAVNSAIIRPRAEEAALV